MMEEVYAHLLVDDGGVVELSSGYFSDLSHFLPSLTFLEELRQKSDTHCSKATSLMYGNE